jgi:hypothetical protein
MFRSHTLLKVFRKVHLYLGVFTAPALLFFAFTGALQTFSLHDTSQGSNYKPPAWIVALAQLHKKQTTSVPVRKQKPNEGQKNGKDRTDASKPKHQKAAESVSATAPAPDSSQEASMVPSQPDKAADMTSPKPKNHLPMKIFFLIVAVGLFLSTLTGIYMAYRYARSPLLISGVLAAGIAIPLILLPF